MASRKIQTYQNKAKNLCTISFLCLTWTANANSLRQNIIVIKEICSSQLPPWWDEQEEILFTERCFKLLSFCYNNLYNVHWLTGVCPPPPNDISIVSGVLQRSPMFCLDTNLSTFRVKLRISEINSDGWLTNNSMIGPTPRMYRTARSRRIFVERYGRLIIGVQSTYGQPIAWQITQ